MKSPITCFFLLFFTTSLLFAQDPPVETGNIPISASSGGGQYGSMFANLINKKKLDIHDRVGSPYLYGDWAPAKLKVMGEAVTFEQAKIDVLNNCLEVQVDGAERILDLQYIGEFTMTPTEQGEVAFFNGNRLTYDGKKLNGFVKVMTVGDMSLLRWYKAKVVEPTESVKITGGDPRVKIVQFEELYLMQGDKLERIKGKGDLLDAMHRREGRMKKYLKDHKVNMNDDAALVAMLEYYQEGME